VTFLSITDWITSIATAVGAIAMVLGALATFLAVVTALAIAIWGDRLESLAVRPKLTLSISMQAPDCVRIQTTAPGVLMAGKILAYLSYYFRLSVGNDGSAAANNVEVRAIALSRLNPGTGQYENDLTFMPLNLTWSNVGGTVIAKIDAQLPKHCDLAHVDKPSQAYLQLCTEVVPNQVAPNVWPTIKPAGDYRLRIAATADNSKPVYRALHIAFRGTWYANESDMFTKGCVVTVETP